MATKAQIAAAAAEAEDVAYREVLGSETFDAESLNPALETLFAEMGVTDGGDATVHVTKLDANGRGSEAQIWKGDPDQYDLEQLARKFGSGEYRVKVYVRIPTGQKVMKANKVFSWLLSPEDEARRLNPTQPQHAAQPVDISRQIAEAVAAAVAPLMAARQPQPDPMAMMSSLAGIMRDLQPQAQHVAQPSQTNPLEMIRSVIEITQMMKGESDPVDRGVNASTNDVLLGMVNKFGPLLMGALAQGPGASMTGMPQAQPAVEYQQNPTRPPQPQQAPQSPQPGVEDVNLQLKMGINFLLMQCEAGGAPETYAEVVLDSVPTDAMQSLLAQPDPIAWLATIDKRVEEPANAEWFRELIASARDLLAPDGNDANATGSAAG